MCGETTPLMRLFFHKSLVVYERIKLHKTQEFEKRVKSYVDIQFHNF